MILLPLDLGPDRYHSANASTSGAVSRVMGILRLDKSLHDWGDFLSSMLSVVVFNFRHVAAEVEGVAEPHHNGAPGWSADPIQVIADVFHGSIALNGVGQTNGFGHGITFETAAVLRIHDWTGLRQPIRVWFSLRLSVFLKNCAL